MNETILWSVIGVAVTLATTAFAVLHSKNNRKLALTVLLGTLILCGMGCFSFYKTDIVIEDGHFDSPDESTNNSSDTILPTQFVTATATPSSEIDTTSAKIINSRPLNGIIAAGNDFTVALSSDGTVKQAGNDDQISVDKWNCITQLSAHGKHVLGLRQDQTVVFSGVSNDGEKNVSAWTNIVEVATSNKGSFGLTTKGRVRFTGYDISDLSACESWTGVKRIYDGEDHFIALGNSGMLVGSGSHGGGDGRRKISELTDVVTACAANGSTFAVFSDGTVQALGTNYMGEDDVSSWTSIVAVAGGERHTVGLRDDGTVVAAGENNQGQCNVTDWTDIVGICCGQYHTVGVRNDGTLVATGMNNSGQCDVGAIDLW